jgi:hypothetical protein
MDQPKGECVTCGDVLQVARGSWRDETGAVHTPHWCRRAAEKLSREMR